MAERAVGIVSSLIKVGKASRMVWRTPCLVRPVQQLIWFSHPRPSVPLLRQPVVFMSSESSKPRANAKTINVIFVDRDRDEFTVKAKIGDSLMEVAKEHDIEVEGACEGTLSCSTCHMIVDPEWFDKIPDPLTEEEQDMLDLAFGLTDTSRLGCQILASPELNGIRLRLPTATRDIRNI